MKPQVLKIRSLSDPAVNSESSKNGEITGLERISKLENGKINGNVLVVHGMGWSQRAEHDNQLGFDVVTALEAEYGVTGTLSHINKLCPQTDEKGKPLHNYAVGGVTISNSSPPLHTDSPLTILNSSRKACLDKIVVNLNGKGTISVYRLFWDNDFYNSYEYPNLGYDDNLYNWPETTTPEHLGYEHIDELRSSINSSIKTSLVTYGFSDATMYLGPVGDLVREAISGGICAAIDDATGQAQYFEESREQKPTVHTTAELCAPKQGGKAAPFTIITKSLGSRVVFDVLTQDRTQDIAQKLRSVSNEKIEVFMLANQIPLLSIGRLTPLIRQPAPINKSLRFVAVSEINDLLTYELVPYFEHLYYIRCIGTREITQDNSADCKISHPYTRMDNFRRSGEIRSRYVSELGYDVVDVRAKYAPPFLRYLPFVPFSDPSVAHTGQMAVTPIRHLFICGVDRGKIRSKEEGCAIR